MCSRAKSAAERKGTQPEADRSPSTNSAMMVMAMVMSVMVVTSLGISGARRAEHRRGDEHRSQS
jgi:hypothetical protein